MGGLFNLISIGYKARTKKKRELLEKLQKTREVGQMMIELYGKHQTLTPSQIINQLYQLHEFCEMPIYWTIGYIDSVAYPIFCYIVRHSDLSLYDVERLAQMLLWPEVKKFAGNNSCRLLILNACERFPTENIAKILSEHLPFIEAELERERKGYFRDQWFGTEYVLAIPAGGKNTPLYNSLHEEIERTKKILSIFL